MRGLATGGDPGTARDSAEPVNGRTRAARGGRWIGGAGPWGDDAPAGCVALRQIDAEACEMKRMFVYPQFHGLGIGRALADAVIERARQLNYARMLLDTSWRQKEAQALYRSYGFRDVAPYYDLPDDLRSWLVFMELPLDTVNR